MALYCVVISGRLPEGQDDAAVWAPIARAFNLDDQAFAEKVLPRIPMIVKQGLDQASAEAMASKLGAAGIDARAVLEDDKLVLIERAGTVKGPVPFGNLSDFVRDGERYRFRDESGWLTWPPSFIAEQSVAPSFVFDPPDEPLAQLVVPTSPFQTASTDDDVPPPLPTGDASPPLSRGSSSLSDPWAKPASTAELSADEIPPPFGEVPPPFTTVTPASAARAAQSPASTLGRQVQEELPPAFISQHQSTAQHAGPSSVHRPVLPDRTASVASGKSWGVIFGVSGLIVALAVSAAGYYFYTHRSQPVDAAVTSQSTAPQAGVLPQPAAVPSQQPSPPVTQPAAATVAPQASPAVVQGAASAMDNCSADAPVPQAAEERELVANGDRHLVGKAVRGGTAGEIYVVEAALGYDGQCRPSPYQIYVFRNQQQVGTLAPQAMLARSDGSIIDFKFVDAEHLRLEISHYSQNSPACCADSTESRIVDLSTLGASVPAASAPVVPTQPTVRPSFDCQMAQTTTEMAICSDSKLARLDAEMGRDYHEAVARSSSMQAASLKDEQRQWIRQRSQCGSEPACIQQSLQMRIQQLHQEVTANMAQARQVQQNRGKLDAANECFRAANYDCSIQIARSLLSANPNDAMAVDLLRRSQAAQAQALHGNWNIH